MLVVGDLGAAVAEDGPFVAVAGVGGLEEEVAGADLHQDREDLGHVDVADVRALVVAPADVDADAVLGDAVERVVQRLDMGLGDLDELVVGEVGEQHVPRQREVGAVELQVEAGGDDGRYSSRIASARAAR